MHIARTQRIQHQAFGLATGALPLHQPRQLSAGKQRQHKRLRCPPRHQLLGAGLRQRLQLLWRLWPMQHQCHAARAVVNPVPLCQPFSQHLGVAVQRAGVARAEAAERVFGVNLSGQDGLGMNVVIGQPGVKLGVDHLPFLPHLLGGKQGSRQHVGELRQTGLQPLGADREKEARGVRRGAGVKTPAPLRHQCGEGTWHRPLPRAHEQHVFQQVRQPRQVIGLGMTAGSDLHHRSRGASVRVVDQQA